MDRITEDTELYIGMAFGEYPNKEYPYWVINDFDDNEYILTYHYQEGTSANVRWNGNSKSAYYDITHLVNPDFVKGASINPICRKIKQMQERRRRLGYSF